MGLENPNLTGTTTEKGADEKKKERCRITVPADAKKNFDDTFKGSIMRASDLSSAISELFSAAFSDFAGCWIEPYAQGAGFDVKLYFNPAQNNGQGQMCAFEVDNGDDVKSDSSILRTIRQREQLPTRKIFKLTDEAEEALADFYPRNLKNGNGIPLWNQGLCFEQAMNGNMNNGVYAVIRCLDLNRICQEIYGNKDQADGSYVEYQFTPLNVVAPQYNSINYGNDCAILIQVTSAKKAEAAGRAVGIISSFGIPMVGRR